MAELPIEDFDKLQTKYRLLEVAARHIAIHGFEGASLRRIAAEAGVSAAAIYRHYPGGKFDLYEAMLGLVSNSVNDLVRNGQRGGTVVDQVVAQCDQMWEFFAAYPSVAAMVVRENIAGGPHGPSPYFDENARVVGKFRELLDTAIEDERVRPVNVSAFLFWVTTYVTNFHGCTALRGATWREGDLENARADFLGQVRERLSTETDNSVACRRNKTKIARSEMRS